MTHSIYIGQGWQSSAEYNDIVSWLDAAQLFRRLTWENCSVTAEEAAAFDIRTEAGLTALRSKVAEHIELSTTVIMIATMYVLNKKMIDYEIDTAIATGKRLIVINPFEKARVPYKFAEHADLITGNNREAVVRSILL